MDRGLTANALLRMRRTVLLIGTAPLLFLSAESAHAQFAKVTGTVSKPRGGTAPDAVIRAMKHGTVTEALTLVHAEANGQYRIENLQKGKYDLFACGLPYWPDERNGLGITLKDGDVKTVKFILQDPPPGDSPKMRILLNAANDPENDGYIYLRDLKTGCVLEQLKWNPAGSYEFTRLEIPFSVCTRKRMEGEEGLKCFAP